jgi:uncharacterized membrane protein YebE (DUF533 family)
MIDVDKIIAALRTDPQGTLTQWGTGAADAAGAMVERIKTDPAARTAAIAGGGGVLAGLVLARSKGLGGALVKLGGMAALGGLAYHAWRKHQARQNGSTVPDSDGIDAPPAGFLPGPEDGNFAKLTLRAMINAAKADGAIDQTEKARLFDRLGQVTLTEEEKAFLFDELAKPIDTDGLVAAVGSPQAAAHVYAASLLAIDVDQPAEQRYLDDLARRLNLAPELAAEIRSAAA